MDDKQREEIRKRAHNSVCSFEGCTHISHILSRDTITLDEALTKAEELNRASTPLMMPDSGPLELWQERSDHQRTLLQQALDALEELYSVEDRSPCIMEGFAVPAADQAISALKEELLRD